MRTRHALVAVIGAAVALAPFVLSDLRLTQLTRQICLVLAILGVSILTGRAGLVSLGHGVFVGIGAFATATLASAGAPLPVAVVGATLIAGAFGIVLGIPALRVRGPHLALITLGTALAFGPLSKQFPGLTGGSTGLSIDTSGFAAPSSLGGADATAEWRYGVTLVVVAIWFWFARNLLRSRPGRAIMAVNDNELAAAAFGVRPLWAKVGTLGVTAAMAGTAGSLYALSASFVLTSQFEAMLSFRLYAAAVLGGAGSLLGPIIGTGFLSLIPELADRVPAIGNQDVLFGLALLIATVQGNRRSSGRLRAWVSGRRRAE